MALDKLKNLFNKDLLNKNLLSKFKKNKDKDNKDDATDNDDLDLFETSNNDSNTESPEQDNNAENNSGANELNLDDFFNDDSLDPTHTEPINKDNTNENNTEDNLNSAINDLLREDANTEVVDVNYDYINDVTVHDTVRNDKSNAVQELRDEYEAENKEEDTKNKKVFTIFYIIILGLLALILAISIAIIIMVSKNGGVSSATNQNTVVKKETPQIVSQSEYTSNSANSIFIRKEKIFEDKKIKLEKMIADTEATVFYFKNNIDTQRYTFTLTDNSKKLYSMDLYFVESKASEEITDGETVVRFEPLNPAVTQLTLNLRNNSTGENIDFLIEFESKLQLSEARYLKNPVVIQNDEFTAKITNAVLSSTGTRIEYLIKNANDKKYKITQGLKSNSDYIEFEEGSTTKSKKKDIPEVFTFNNGDTFLGRMDFMSVHNFSSTYYVTLKDIFKKYETNNKVFANTVASTSQSLAHEYEVDNYKIVFEGLAPFDDKFVLVFHCEDKNIPYNKDNPTANRVEAIIDAQLVGETSSGMEVILDGTCTAAQRGTDMVFPVNDNAKDFIFSVPREKLRVDVKSILVKMDDIKIQLSENQFRDKKSEERNTFDKTIITSFQSRLKYKSDRSTISSIIGFDNSLIADATLMDNYKPVETDEDPVYSVQVISADIDGDSAIATIQETWVGVSGSTETHFFRKHKIFATKTNMGWIVKNDVIIK